METAPQQKRQGYRPSIFASVAGMVITFLAGVYVGLHPTWIPIKLGASSEDYAKPPVNVMPATAPAHDRPPDRPQTQPSTQGQ